MKLDLEQGLADGNLIKYLHNLGIYNIEELKSYLDLNELVAVHHCKEDIKAKIEKFFNDNINNPFLKYSPEVKDALISKIV